VFSGVKSSQSGNPSRYSGFRRLLWPQRDATAWINSAREALTVNLVTRMITANRIHIVPI
jgi:hypothetical protein